MKLYVILIFFALTLNSVFGGPQLLDTCISRLEKLLQTIAKVDSTYELVGNRRLDNSLDRFNSIFKDFRTKRYQPVGKRKGVIFNNKHFQDLNNGKIKKSSNDLIISTSFAHLKEVNDSFQKAFGTAAENMYKELIMAEFVKKENIDLLEKLNPVYWEFKILRTHFVNVDAKQAERAYAIIKQADDESKELIKYALSKVNNKKLSKLADISDWHRIGRSSGEFVHPGIADLNANFGGLEFDDFMRLLKTHLDETRDLSDKFIAVIKKNRLDDKEIGSSEIWEVLRKTEKKEELMTRLDNRYGDLLGKKRGTTISKDDATIMLDYYKALYKFSPELYLDRRVSPKYKGLKNFISADIRGMGAQNVLELHNSFRKYLLKTKKGRALNLEAILNFRLESEKKATEWLEMKIARYKGIGKKLGVVGVDSTGDDIFSRLHNWVRKFEFGKKRFRSFGKEISKSDSPTSFRLVHGPGGKVSQGERISRNLEDTLSAGEVNSYIADVENVLKEFDVLCELERLYQDCKRIIFFGEITPYKEIKTGQGKSKIKLLYRKFEEDYNYEMDYSKIKRLFTQAVNKMKESPQIHKGKKIVLELEVVP